MRMGRLGVLIILGIILIVSVSSLVVWLANDHPTLNQQRYDLDSLVQYFKENHLLVEESADSNTYALFEQEPGTSQMLRTNKGTLDVVFFTTDVSSNIKIKETKPHNWIISGVTKEPRNIGSMHNIYFIVHHNIFIQTFDEDLYKILNKMLK